MGYLRVGFGVEEGFIDEYQLKSCFETSLKKILEAAKDLPLKNRLQIKESQLFRTTMFEMFYSAYIKF